jgi:hypothetical protein
VTDAQEPATLLFEAFKNYELSQDHELSHTQTAFGRYLTENGYPSTGKRVKSRIGLRLKPEAREGCDSRQPEIQTLHHTRVSGKVTEQPAQLSQPSPEETSGTAGGWESTREAGECVERQAILTEGSP